MENLPAQLPPETLQPFQGSNEPARPTLPSPEDMEGFRQALDHQEQLSIVIPDVFRSIRTRVPGGFQSERLAEMLDDRFGSEALEGILQSLKDEGRASFYFPQIQSDFEELRRGGGSEDRLRRECQNVEEGRE